MGGLARAAAGDEAFCFLIPSGKWFWPLLLAGSLPTVLALFRLAF